MGMGNPGQPNEYDLFAFVCPRQNRVLERPHLYLTNRIFRILVVLPKSREWMTLPQKNVYQKIRDVYSCRWVRMYE